jgi:hypothetical protein
MTGVGSQNRQHQNSRALVPHESMGGQTTTAAAAAATERFFSDPEGDELPLPSNQERDSEFNRFNPGPQLHTLAEESEPTSLNIQEGNYIIFDDRIDDAQMLLLFVITCVHLEIVCIYFCTS